MFKRKNKKKAFTLIELLVVIAIIAIIATIAVVASQNSRRGARDVKRLADVRQLRVALELYHNNNGSYPGSLNALIPDYLAEIPQAPSPADGDCTSENNQYVYSSDGGTYTISFCLGSSVGEYAAGHKTANQMGIETTAGGGDVSCGETFVDSRDGNSYDTVLVGGQCWMADNLAYLPAVHGYDDFISAADNNTAAYAVYGYDGNDVVAAKGADNYNTYGVLYNWQAASGGTGTAGGQGACPSGWHLPTISEWQTFADTVNNNPAFYCGPSNGTAKALASSFGWNYYDEGPCYPAYNQATANNASGFNFSPTGVRFVGDPDTGVMSGSNIQSGDVSLGYTISLFSINISQESMFVLNIDYSNYDIISTAVNLNDMEEQYNEHREMYNTHFGVETFEEFKDVILKTYTSAGDPVRCVKN